jgi:hypothetical protein
MLNLSAEFTLPLLEEQDMPFDLLLQRAFAQFENAFLLFEFLLESQQGWEGHFALTLHSGRRLRYAIGKAR